MRNAKFILVVLLTIVLTNLSSLGRSSSDCSQNLPGVDPLVQGQAIVQLADNITIQDFLNAFNTDYPSLNAASIDAIPAYRLHLIQFNPPSPAMLHAIEDDLHERYVGAYLAAPGDLVYEGAAPEGKSGSTWVDSVAPEAAYAAQYAVQRLNLPSAQQLSTGAGVVVAVLDTGIDATHPALQGRIAPGGYNFVLNNTNTADVGDGLDNDGDDKIDEMTGHGTYVAGLIALVAPGAKLLPVTVLNSDGVGDGWLFTKGIYYAIDRGVEVINLSLSSTYDTNAVFEAILYARSKGIAVVAAAGNLDRDCPREYPAMEDDHGVLGVAAVDHNDIKAEFSNYNKRLFISAPGTSASSGADRPNLDLSIISTVPGGEYRVWEGTSMATALVTGAVALIRVQHPEWPYSPQTVTNIRQIIASTAVDIYPLNPQFAKDEELGKGRLNIGAAVGTGPSAPALGDLNSDGVVGVSDLLKTINDWGMVHTSADIDGDGTVGIGDLLIIIANWG